MDTPKIVVENKVNQSQYYNYKYYICHTPSDWLVNDNNIN